MKYIQNRENIEGRVYQHNLNMKSVQDPNSANFGKTFISGELEVAVDEEGLNVIPVHFTYVTETTNSGKKNGTFTVLKRIIEEEQTWVTVGKDDALKVKINTAIGLNEFYSQDDQLVSVKRNEGGFVSTVNQLASNENERNTFSADMFITSTQMIEADPEKNIDEDYMLIKGAIFNFRKELLPIEFVLRNKKGIELFEKKEITNANPLYTNVWGNIECRTIKTMVTKENAFGEPAVTTYERKTKEWVIEGAAPEEKEYEYGNEEVLTAEEITAAMQDREKKLAALKARQEEYRAQKGTAATAPKATASQPTAVKQGTFNF